MNSAERHFGSLTALLFSSRSSGTPLWLQHAVADTQARYSGIGLTGQFKAAIAAFDDSGSPKPFELFVVGEGKFGKSTLVNCLLGEELSRVRGLPETRCFLRYVVSDRPRATVRLYVRYQPGMHDWLERRIGPGTPVNELWEIKEHEVPISSSRAILEEEFSRIDGGGYEPAIYEVERDVQRSPNCAFKAEIRIVDTPGLDQLFPDELIRETEGMSEETSAERYIHWLNHSQRGKHLEWQWRRCDAALWCVSSRRLGSAVTATSLSYFSNYSKKIVMALTHFDVARNEMERKKLLDKAATKYFASSSVIKPVNGKAAWQALSDGSESALDSTGFKELVGSLTTICEAEGLKVRNLARYSALRTTEAQYRSVLSILRADYCDLLSKEVVDRQRIQRSAEGDWRDLNGEIHQVASDGLRRVLGRIRDVDYRDGRQEVMEKLSLNQEAARLSSRVMSTLRNRVGRNIEAQAELTSPYNLPAFDADGARAGTVASISPQLRSPELEVNLPTVQFHEGDWIDNAVDYLDEKFGGLIDLLPGVDSKSEERRASRRADRQRRIRESFDVAWKDYHRAVALDSEHEVERLYAALFDAIRNVMSRVEKHVGCALPQAIEQIDRALSGVSLPPAFSAQLLLAMQGKIAKGQPARAATSNISVTPVPERPRQDPGRAAERSWDMPSSASRRRVSAGTLQEGQRVRHRTLGQGTIESIRGNYFHIRFDDTLENLRMFAKDTVRDPSIFQSL